MYQNLIIFCITTVFVCNAVVEPDLYRMSLPRSYQSYTFNSALSMDAAASWTVFNSATQLNDSTFRLANNNFGLASNNANLPSGSINFRIEFEVDATYSASTCESFGFMLHNGLSIPILTRTLGVNKVATYSGLMLFQQLCQYGAVRASFESGVNILPTDVPNLGTALESSCAKCASITSGASSAKYQVVIQVVNEYLSVSSQFSYSFF